MLINKNWNAIESLSERISIWIKKNRELEELEYLKIKLGIEIILINLSKGVIVYAVAS